MALNNTWSGTAEIGLVDPEGFKAGGIGKRYLNSNTGTYWQKNTASGMTGWQNISATEEQAGQAAEATFNLNSWPTPGDTITIADPLVGTVVYEWNANNPPVGGTPGMVWLYVGGGSIEAKTILALAWQAAADPRIVYNAVPLPRLYPSVYSPTPSIHLYSTIAPGSAVYEARSAAQAWTLAVTNAGGPPSLWTTLSSYGQRAAGVRRVERFTYTFSSLDASIGAAVIQLPWQVGGGLAQSLSVSSWRANVQIVGTGNQVLVQASTPVLAGDMFYLTVWEV